MGQNGTEMVRWGARMIVQDAEAHAPGTGAKRRPSDQALVAVAVLIEEQVPDADIAAAAFGVSRRTLNRWKRYPEMQLLPRWRHGRRTVRRLRSGGGPLRSR